MRNFSDRMAITIGISARKLDKLEATSRENFLLDVVNSCVMSSSYPRTALSAQILELEDDGSNYALVTNATCLALIDSGISMRFLFAGVNCAIVPGKPADMFAVCVTKNLFFVIDRDEHKNYKIVVDPTSKQLLECSCEIFFIFENRNFEMLSLQITKGTCSDQQLQDSLKSAQNASKTVFQFYKETVQKKFSKELADLTTVKGN